MSDDHQEKADEAERELDEMQERADDLEHRVEETRSTWEARKQDPGVPGAGGDPEARDEDLPPEADYTSRGD